MKRLVLYQWLFLAVFVLNVQATPSDLGLAKPFTVLELGGKDLNIESNSTVQGDVGKEEDDNGGKLKISTSTVTGSTFRDPSVALDLGGGTVVGGSNNTQSMSAIVADAQAAYRVTQAEWQRVKLLGRKTVGDKRYITARSEFDASLGKLTAFGLSEQAIKELPKKKSTVLGVYTLTAATSGAVLSDDFHQGQLIAAGGTLMEVADEQELWVEARISPQKTLQLPEGTQALVKVAEGTFQARVAQEAHIIDQDSRTRVIRLLVDNSAHRLHPGMFADVFFQFKTDAPVLAVTEDALMRSADGDWTVFVEHEAGKFEAQEIELGRSLGQWREIIGLEAGTRVVTKGAFFVASQIAKGGFDPHNH